MKKKVVVCKNYKHEKEVGVLIKEKGVDDGDCFCKWIVEEYKDGEWVVAKSNKFNICQLVNKLNDLQEQGYSIETETEFMVNPNILSKGRC